MQAIFFNTYGFVVGVGTITSLVAPEGGEFSVVFPRALVDYGSAGCGGLITGRFAQLAGVRTICDGAVRRCSLEYQFVVHTGDNLCLCFQQSQDCVVVSETRRLLGNRKVGELQILWITRRIMLGPPAYLPCGAL